MASSSVPTSKQPGANPVLESLPAFPDGHVALCGSRWPRLLLGSMAVLLGLGLAFEATNVASRIEAASLATAFVLSALLLAGGIRIALHKQKVVLVCSPSGLYFPRKNGKSEVGPWLWVPWRNVATYEVQRLLDETSVYGLVLALRLSADEENSYLAPYRLLGRSTEAGSNDQGHRTRRFGIGNLASPPDVVVAQLRQFEMAGYASSSEYSAMPVSQ